MEQTSELPVQSRTKLEHAREYVRLGLSVIPLKVAGKKPLIPWKEFQSRRATDEEIYGWFGEETIFPFGGTPNIGIVTGSISGVAVIDCDSIDATMKARELGLPEGPTVKTGRGWHFYYAHAEGVGNFQKRADLPGIDLRAEGGFVVAPPSIHESGVPYHWENRSALGRELAPLPAWVFAQNAQTSTQNAAIVAPHLAPVAPLPASELITTVATEGNRNNTLARMVGGWANSWPYDVALETALAWSKLRCHPPLESREVERTVHSIYQKEHAKRERLKSAGWVHAGQKRHADSTELSSESTELLSDSDSLPHRRVGRESGKAELFKPTPLATLLREPQEITEYLVEGLLPTAGTSVLAARPKVGKSTFGRQLIVSVATGDEFIGRACNKSRVGYLALEEKRSAIADHFRRMAVPQEAPIFIHTGPLPPGEPIKLLRSFIVEFNLRFVVIDPLQHFLRVADISNYSEVSLGLASILDVARATGAHVLITHHTNKGDSGSGEERAVLGSTALFGGVDTLLMMSRKNDVRSMTSTQRYGVDMPPTTIRLTEDGRIELAGTVTAMQQHKLVSEIVAILRESGAMAEEQICVAIGKNREKVRSALRSDHAKQFIVTAGKGVKANPFRYSVLDS